MIGSGIFLLPAILAPYGSISLIGWLVTGLATIFLALILGRLANRTAGIGGPYAYARESFGDLTGFLIGWGYWVSVTLSVTAIALAFAGYLGNIVPALGGSNLMESGVALIAIWLFTIVNIRAVSSAAWVQLFLTILKLVPLIVVIGLGAFAGSLDSLPPLNPRELPVVNAIAATALLTMWAFIGVEAAVIPASDVVDAKRTIPRAVVAAALTVGLVYVLVTLAIMMLVPYEALAESQAPFVDAARKMGPWATWFIAIGALVSTAGSLNGNILVAGQMPMAMSLDGLAPKVFGERNAGHAPVSALLLSSILSSALLLLNFSDSLIGAFTFLISMATLCALAPYCVSALAELKHSWRSARGWTLIALLTVVYTVVAAAGSGWAVLLWGLILMLTGVPVYVFSRRAHPDG